MIIGLECGLARAEQASLACYLNARPTVCWLMSRRPLLEERFAMLGFGLPLLFYLYYGANARDNITLLRTLAGPDGTGYDRCLHVSIVVKP